MNKLATTLAGVLFVLGSGSAAWSGNDTAPEPRRSLHVELYPFIPDADNAAYVIKHEYERMYPDVDLQITYNQDYYDDDGVAADTADVYELDSVLLTDFIAKKIQALPQSLAALLQDSVPLARIAAQQGGSVYGIPHWLCTNFLIYKSGDRAFESARSLSDIEKAVKVAAPGTPKLLIDLRGRSTLGEFYLNAVYDEYGSPFTALAHINPEQLDGLAQASFPRMLALDADELGRDETYHAMDGWYGRDFAHGRGRALVGYSESLYFVLTEANGCRPRTRCISQSDIRVGNWPTTDLLARPVAWVDMYVLDKTTSGTTMLDAINFIRMMDSLSMYRMLLVARPGQAPRYLMPARADAYHDHAILKSSPLYPEFYRHIQNGSAVTEAGLNGKLRAIGKKIDAALPAWH